MGKNNEKIAKFKIGDKVKLHDVNMSVHFEEDLKNTFLVEDFVLNGFNEYVYKINRKTGFSMYFEKNLKAV